MTAAADPSWPELDYASWKSTCKTVHLWTQIVGKLRLAKTPWINHSWNSTLYVTEQGLTTSVIHDKAFSFSVELDFISHVLRITRSDGQSAVLSFASEPVATFHGKCLAALSDLGIEARIDGRPNELVDAIPFAKDLVHRTYEPVHAQRFWRILLQAHRLMTLFRSRFIGKVSPVHFFWGSFDLAVTRFSGRRAPEHPGGVPNLPDLVTRDAYSHEVSSCGFWPGNDQFPQAAFYSYAYPSPENFALASVPEGAFYHETLREFILPYDAVRRSRSPDDLVLDFFQRTYEAAARLGNWDRALVEESPYLHALQARTLGRKAA